MRKTLVLILLLVPALLWAKRLPPPVVLPVDDGTYRFVVRENGKPNWKGVYKGGHVEAYLKKTGEKIWERYLYTVQVEKGLERDAQDVFLKKMYLDRKERLILQNEKGKWFVLDRRTGEPVHNQDFLRKEDDLSVYYVNPDKVEPVLKGDYYIGVDDRVGYGRQIVRAYDIPTGRLIWEAKVPVPKVRVSGRGNRIAFLWLNDSEEVEITFWDNSGCRLDARNGGLLSFSKPE